MIWPAGAQPLSTNAEIVRVTARSTDTLTITRAQESTSARTVVVGDQIMAAIVLNDGGTLTPEDFEAFLAAQSDLSPKGWPRYVRIARELPTTATHKVLKRELAAQGPTAGDGELWVREPRGTRYTRV